MVFSSVRKEIEFAFPTRFAIFSETQAMFGDLTPNFFSVCATVDNCFLFFVFWSGFYPSSEQSICFLCFTLEQVVYSLHLSTKERPCRSSFLFVEVLELSYLVASLCLRRTLLLPRLSPFTLLRRRNVEGPARISPSR